MVSSFKTNQKKLFITGLQVLTCFFLYSFVWVFAAPITYNFLKKSKTVLRIALELVFLSIVFYGTGFLNLWIFLIPILGLELALFVRKKESLRLNSLYQLIVLAGVILLHLSIYVFVDIFWSQALDQEIYRWYLKINELWTNFTSQLGSDDRFKELADTRWVDYLDYLPTIYFCSFIIGYLGCYWRTRILARFRCPDFLFWVTIFAFALGFLRWDGLWDQIGQLDSLAVSFEKTQTFAANLFIVLSCIYFFQGLSVSSYLMEKFKITRFWQNLWYILVILNLPMVLVVFGLVDFLFEFRSPKGSAR